MNTEDSQDKAVSMTTGQRLREAREKLGFSQQAVAERLCLKLSTVRDIEADTVETDLASTFVRGYIRSYAKLVHLPEDELLPMLTNHASKVTKVAQMQSFSLGKRRKKRDGWLMSFTWLIVFVVVGLTGAWWWQNHKAQQEELATMVDNSSAQLSQQNGGQSVPVVDNGAVDNGAAAVELNVASENVTTPAANSAAAAQQAPTTVDLLAAAQQPAVVAPSQAAIPDASVPAALTQLPTGNAELGAPAAEPNALVMDFSNDCWLEVKDATGKTLFSGMQKSGARLNLAGTAPYKLTIGAPAAVQIQFQGQPVDLSRFIKSNRVARLSVPAQ